MIISYGWLKDYVDFKASAQEIADILTSQLSETVILNQSGNWKNVITAKVNEVKKHPNADKLSLCSVTDGKNTYSVVCGAPNVAPGQIVPFAMLGAELPSGFKIEKRAIRGIESEGMICSERELAISENAQGIMVLPSSTPIGKDLKTVLKNLDATLEIETTTNRPDCINHIGIAREIAAHFRKPVKLPKLKSPKLTGDLKISIKDNDLCPRYIGRKITGIKVGPSPEWLARRLEACGLRPINNIVDITNYVLLETGHPLHAFDLALLDGQEIIVRRAKNDEKITALDGKEYKMDNSILVIADKTKPQAIAGVMGGEFSGVTEKTTDIILESAIFLPSNIHPTTKKLNVVTDSSYRFERGTSWENAEYSSCRAAELIIQLAGGKIEAKKDVYSTKNKPLAIKLRPQRVKNLLGVDLSTNEIQKLLDSLGIKSKKNKELLIAEVPYWRLDISQEADLIEEVARIYGYDKIPATVLPLIPKINESKKDKPIEEIISERLVSLGFCEAINYSFTSEDNLKKYDMHSVEEVANPLSREYESMRPSLLPVLMTNLNLNLSQGYKNIKLFEIGKTFAEHGEKKKLGIIVYGNIWKEWWKFEEFKIKPPSIDFHYLVGIIQNIFREQDISYNKEKPLHYFHPGKFINLLINNKAVGYVGIINPKYSKDTDKEIAYVEIDLESIKWHYKTQKMKRLRRFPKAERDLSLVSDKSITFDQVFDSLQTLVSKLGILESSEVFSVYEGANLGPNKISYSLHLTFRHPNHTLSESEINSAINTILDTLKKNLNVTLRI
ncbi:MAG: phenylalanine--tRNA ligase subunit beta [Endomicrobiales bacterium]|nr:phenylalanine--tRNA ligase subunit beta [Endomicrobiales bacterium]